MRVLAIDTATAHTGVAIGDAGGILAAAHQVSDRRHVETLVPLIERVCRDAKAGLDTIDLIAVDVGPGTFTGLRVGLAAAKALAYTRQIPMVGVCSLELLAFGSRHANRRIVSLIDALRDEVFYASYRIESGQLIELTSPRVAAPEVVAAELVRLGEPCIVVGDGAVRYAQAFSGLDGAELGGPAWQYPSASTLVAMAIERASRGDAVPPTAIELLYLRPAYTDRKVLR